MSRRFISKVPEFTSFPHYYHGCHNPVDLVRANQIEVPGMARAIHAAYAATPRVTSLTGGWVEEVLRRFIFDMSDIDPVGQTPDMLYDDVVEEVERMLLATMTSLGYVGERYEEHILNEVSLGESVVFLWETMGYIVNTLTQLGIPSTMPLALLAIQSNILIIGERK